MMIRVSIVFFISFLFTPTIFLLPYIDYTGNEKIVLTGGFESTNAFISYVTINGHNYIIKQKKRSNSQLGAARDALAAYIAKDLNIAHAVAVIAANVDVPGKINSVWPATLHTIAAGKTVRSQKESKYYALALKQRLPGVKITGQWLTEKIIDQITWHKQLPIIIALDLFICNTDRHSGNLFYDPETDRFCAIDMDSIFRRDLPEMACQKLDEMINVHLKEFTEKEIKALISVKKTINFLLSKYSSQHLINKFRFFVKQSGFIKGNPLYTERVQRKIAHHESMIITSRASLHKLMAMLNGIINKFYDKRFYVNNNNYFVN